MPFQKSCESNAFFSHEISNSPYFVLNAFVSQEILLESQLMKVPVSWKLFILLNP
jgi:hypothetical protein